MKLLLLLAFLVSCGREIETIGIPQPATYDDAQLQAKIAEIEGKLELMQEWNERSDSDIKKLIDELEQQLEELKRLQSERNKKH